MKASLMVRIGKKRLRHSAERYGADNALIVDRIEIQIIDRPKY